MSARAFDQGVGGVEVDYYETLLVLIYCPVFKALTSYVVDGISSSY